MKKTDEQLIVAILNRDETLACESIMNGANVNQIIRQKHIVETTEGNITPLCYEQIETPLIMACRLDLIRVVLMLLGNGANPNLVDNGRAFNEYKSRHDAFDFVLQSQQKIARYCQQMPNLSERTCAD